MTGTFHLQDFLFDVLASNEHVTLALPTVDTRFRSQVLRVHAGGAEHCVRRGERLRGQCPHRELAIAPAPSKAAHARNEPLGWCAPYLPRAPPSRRIGDDAHDVAEGGAQARDRMCAGDCRGGVRARNADGKRAACPAAARLQHRARAGAVVCSVLVDQVRRSQNRLPEQTTHG